MRPALAPSLVRGAAALFLSLGSSAFQDPGPAGGRPPLELEPYVVDVGPTWALLAWRLAAEGPSTIEYGYTVACELGRVASAPAQGGRQHQARLTGLTPGARVHYRVDGLFQESFRTERPDPDFRFGVIGHTHGTEQFGHYPDALLVARLRELDLDFVVHAGDATYHATVEDFARYFFRPFRGLIAGLPVYMAPGNHDAGWPFVDGIDLTPFKELFPYPYPEEIAEGGKQACYAVEKGGTQFLFLSYVSPLGEKSYQRRWLHKRLIDDRHDFNVVVYGGGNSYFAEGEFLEWLSQYPVDCVLNGDSLRRKEVWRSEHGLRIGFVGTGNLEPHPLLYAEARPEVLVLRTLDAAGKAGEVVWIHARREQPPVATLAVGATTHAPARKVALVDLKLAEPVESESIRGIQLRLDVNTSETRTFYVHAFPTTQTGDGPGYQTENFRVNADDELVTLPLPARRPSGEGYAIGGLRVTVLGVLQPGEVEVRAAWLY